MWSNMALPGPWEEGRRLLEVAAEPPGSELAEKSRERKKGLVVGVGVDLCEM